MERALTGRDQQGVSMRALQRTVHRDWPESGELIKSGKTWRMRGTRLFPNREGGDPGGENSTKMRESEKLMWTNVPTVGVNEGVGMCGMCGVCDV